VSLRRNLPFLLYLSVADFGEFHPRYFWASFELLCYPWFWWPQLCVSPAVPTLARIGRLTCSPFQRQSFLATSVLTVHPRMPTASVSRALGLRSFSLLMIVAWRAMRQRAFGATSLHASVGTAHITSANCHSYLGPSSCIGDLWVLGHSFGVSPFGPPSTYRKLLGRDGGQTCGRCATLLGLRL
jgi:hypothetical protein